VNSLFQQLQPKSLKNNNSDLFKQFLSSSNPEQFIQKMASNNPKMQEVMKLFNQSKMTPKDFFYSYAKQKGVDPNQFLNSMK